MLCLILEVTVDFCTVCIVLYNLHQLLLAPKHKHFCIILLLLEMDIAGEKKKMYIYVVIKHFADMFCINNWQLADSLTFIDNKRHTPHFSHNAFDVYKCNS